MWVSIDFLVIVLCSKTLWSVCVSFGNEIELGFGTIEQLPVVTSGL